jgi:hypothetical protein
MIKPTCLIITFLRALPVFLKVKPDGLNLWANSLVLWDVTPCLVDSGIHDALPYTASICKVMVLEELPKTVVNISHILANDQLDALFLNVFISCLYMFRAASAHHQEGHIVLMHHLV